MAEYEVRSGDTLSEIAERHNVDLAALRRENGMKEDAWKIFPGQKLAIPGLDVEAP
ncbi:MAG: LysM peptidoglycan-binding domain-containing protein [Rhodospirillales bacterium]|nr:LysM peptidoglycan-binding domain-containing protein [Rhodospirillales bacterium]